MSLDRRASFNLWRTRHRDEGVSLDIPPREASHHPEGEGALLGWLQYRFLATELLLAFGHIGK